MDEDTCRAARHGTRRAYYQHRCRCPALVEQMRSSWRRKMPPGRCQRGSGIRDRGREVDPIAVERACSGDSIRLTIRERGIAIERLDRLGLTARAISERLGLAPRTVQRYRAGEILHAREAS